MLFDPKSEDCLDRAFSSNFGKKPLAKKWEKMIDLTSKLGDLFVCFIALHPKSTAMVIVGRSVHLTPHFFLGKLEQAVNQYFVHILSLVTDNNPS